MKSSDGRILCVQTFGDPAGRAVLFHSGTWEGRTLYPPLIEDAKRHRLFVIGYDRPGYGGSTAQPGRTIADHATDVTAIAYHLKISRLATIGFSGGGSHAVASAVLLPDLIVASVAFCPLRPIESPSVELNTDEEVSPASTFDPLAARRALEGEREEILAITQEGIMEVNMAFPEKQRVSTAFLDFHYTSMKAAIAPGAEGPLDDIRAYYTPWGLDLNTNRIPIGIWHGKADATVPHTHGEWLAANTPRTEIHLTEDDSHRSIFENSYDEAMKWALPHFDSSI
ncbi:MAG: alpha/beta hydrolase [Actinobacteria bacterium]|nr:alpha/beta hydrolase [Actinomycetota bacterium]